MGRLNEPAERDSVVTTPGSYRAKRVLDLGLIVATSPAWLPLVGMLAAVALIASGRPILFKQERIGRDGKPFSLLKFRTMIYRTDGNAVFPEDQAITPIGRFLRRTSLDELPQLFNVIRGDMSIVGPRPALAYQVARLDAVQLRRLMARPGLTGLAQIRGRNQLSWPQRIELDLEYLATQSLNMDLRIMLRTLAVVWRGQGIGGHPTDDPIAGLPEEQTQKGT